MAGTTTNLDLPYPEPGDPNNPPGDIQALAEAFDVAVPGVVSQAVQDENIPAQVTAAVAADPTVTEAAAGAAVAAVGDALDDAGILHGAGDATTVEAIAFMIVDEQGRRSWIEIGADGKPTDHSVELLLEKLNATVPTNDLTTEAAPGVAFTIVDDDGRRSWLEISNGGGPTDHAMELLRGTLSALPEPMSDRTGVAFAITDQYGRRSWLEIAPDGGPTDHTLAMLGIAGGLTAEDVRDIIGATLVQGAGIAVTVNDAGDTITITNTGGGGETLLMEFVALGDSTTEALDVADPAGRWPALIQTQTGVPTFNRGSSGAKSDEICARMGGMPVTGTPAGGNIPASGGVNLTGLNVDPLGGGGATSLPAIAVAPNGTRIPGTFSRSGSTRTFTRTTAGGAIAVGGLLEIFVFNDLADVNRIPFIGAGINDEPMIIAGTRTVEDTKRWYRAMTSMFPASRPKVVWGVLDRGPAEAPGTATGDFIKALELWLAQTYGTDYLPFRQYLASAQSIVDAELIQPGFAAGRTSAQVDADNAAIAAGTVPPSFRTSSGSVHLNALGSALQARYFVRHLRRKGII